MGKEEDAANEVSACWSHNFLRLSAKETRVAVSSKVPGIVLTHGDYM